MTTCATGSQSGRRKDLRGAGLRMWVWLVSRESEQTSSPGRSGRAPALDPYALAVRSPTDTGSVYTVSPGPTVEGCTHAKLESSY